MNVKGSSQFGKRSLIILTALVLVLSLSGVQPGMADDQVPPPEVEPEREVDGGLAMNVEEKLAMMTDMEPFALSSYRFLTKAGIGFTPSTSGVTYTYIGNGCTSPTSTGQWRTNVNIPDGSVITNIYIGTWNYAGSLSTTGTLTKFNSYTGIRTDIKTVNTLPGTSGINFKWTGVSLSSTETVDNMTYAYMFTWAGPPSPYSASTMQELCYMQIAYIPPSIFGTALPAVTK